MSVTDLDKIDAVGTEQNNNALRLMLADNLGWEYEDVHLEILQDKLDLYYQYINNKLYVEKYGEQYSKFIIDIYFQEKISKKCFEFLEIVKKKFISKNIYINMHF
ncbi:MAG: DUF6572 domain-containing protein [Acutalibacteraceae bacterium]|nr:DUF6572 domain-containing protein [Acutalibacteraceae bacterium]